MRSSEAFVTNFKSTTLYTLHVLCASSCDYVYITQCLSTTLIEHTLVGENTLIKQSVVLYVI